MISDHQYDVIIVGSGAGGGTLVHRLAQTGKRILLLERGDWLPREKDNWNSKAVFLDAKYRADETWQDEQGNAFHPGIQYCVGGNTKFYGAALLRLRREDFAELRHHAGVSPSWPLTYEDFEPYYTAAEELYQVHGQHGVDPTDPPAGRDYPHPPVTIEPRLRKMYDDLRDHGYQPFPLPVGVLLEERDGRTLPNSRCIRCDTCDGFPCLVHAKSDAEVLCVRPALEHPNVTLLTNAYVSRLETNPTGSSVTDVVVEREGEEERYSGEIVVLACGAINSALLLLRSASDQHPDGLANRSGVVGRHYMRHINSAIMAVSKEPNPTVFQKTIGLNDFYFASEDWDYPMGHIQMLGKSDGEMMKGEAPSWVRIKPLMPLEEMARHAIDFWLCTEDLPDPDNRVSIDSRGQTVLSLTDANAEAHKRLRSRFEGMLGQVDLHPHMLPRNLYLGMHVPIAGTAHQCGTVRFGNDPRSSALNTDCKAHDLDNLYVVDGGFFVSAGAVNPALTIIANALRVGEHLVDRVGQLSGAQRSS